MTDKLTESVLTDLRMYSATFNSPASREMESRITEILGDRNYYYDTRVILEQCIGELLNEEDIWKLVHLADELIEADLINK